jgi:fatty acid desaturase
MSDASETTLSLSQQAPPPRAAPPKQPAGAASESQLRDRIRRECPHIFVQQPARAWAMLPIVALGAAGTYAIIAFDMPWYAMLGLSLLIGNNWGAAVHLAHECLHGSVVQQRWLQTLLGYFGFGMLLMSPNLWRVWHNQIHHGKTNNPMLDPDHFGTLRRFKQMKSTQFVNRLAPGSGSIASYFFMFYWLTFHTQVVLWITSRHLPSFKVLNRKLAIADTFGFLLAWSAVAIAAGPMKAVFAVVIPIAIGNFVVMMYLSTNHFMRPLTITNDALDNTMSVKTLAVLDWMHFRFSHHVEHHLFPRVNSKHLPELRAWLQREVPERYVCPSHLLALSYLFRTPRVYLDAKTLVDPANLERRVDTTELARVLSSSPSS